MQTQVQNSRAIRIGSAVLMVDGVNVGALQNVKLKVDQNVLSLTADNAKLPPRKKITKAAITADSWEITLDALNTLDGCGTLTSTPGTSTSVTGEVLKASGTFSANEVLFFANAQGDKTVATAITVKNGATTLTAGTDYAVVVQNGKTGIVRLGTTLTLSGIGLNVGYTYTPNVKKTYTGKDVANLIGMFAVEIYNTDENGKKFGIKFPKAYNASGIEFSFASDDKLDEVMKYPLELVAYPDSSNVLFIMEDEQAV